jgi:hypothetical protein
MITEGLMTLMDILTRNILHYVNPKVYLVSAYTYIINVDFIEAILVALQHIISSGVFPSAMSIIFPVFMYIIALERQQKLKSIMQMHGLKEIHYWLATILNNYLLYMVVYFSFYFVGRYALNLDVFAATSPMLMVSCSYPACPELALGIEPDRYGCHSFAVLQVTENSEYSGLHSVDHGTVHVYLHVHTDVQRSIGAAVRVTVLSKLFILKSLLLHHQALPRSQMLLEF